MADRIFRIQGAAGVRPAFVSAWNIIQGLMRDSQSGYELVLRPLKSKRSCDQNRRYWALLREIEHAVWVNGRQYDDETWHEYFRRQFIGCNELPDGSLVGISTTKLSVHEFGDYMTRIEQWCAEQGFPLMEMAA